MIDVRTVLKGLGILALLALVVLIWLNFLTVSNLEDELRALRADVDDLKRGATPPPAAPTETAVDVEIPQPFAGDPSALPPQIVGLSGGKPVQRAVLALVEIVHEDGSRVPVASTAAILLPQVAAQMPLPPEAGCYFQPARRPSWILTIEGGELRVASRDCIYQRPVRGRLRGTITR